jgi:hypothetical protein
VNELIKKSNIIIGELNEHHPTREPMSEINFGPNLVPVVEEYLSGTGLTLAAISLIQAKDNLQRWKEEKSVLNEELRTIIAFRAAEVEHCIFTAIKHGLDRPRYVQAYLAKSILALADAIVNAVQFAPNHVDDSVLAAIKRYFNERSPHEFTDHDRDECQSVCSGASCDCDVLEGANENTAYSDISD